MVASRQNVALVEVRICHVAFGNDWKVAGHRYAAADALVGLNQIQVFA